MFSVRVVAKNEKKKFPQFFTCKFCLFPFSRRRHYSRTNTYLSRFRTRVRAARKTRRKKKIIVNDFFFFFWSPQCTQHSVQDFARDIVYFVRYKSVKKKKLISEFIEININATRKSFLYIDLAESNVSSSLLPRVRVYPHEFFARPLCLSITHKRKKKKSRGKRTD